MLLFDLNVQVEKLKRENAELKRRSSEVRLVKRRNRQTVALDHGFIAYGKNIFVEASPCFVCVQIFLRSVPYISS